MGPVDPAMQNQVSSKRQRTGDGMMNCEKQKKYRDKKVDDENKKKKKMKDRLRYLQKKEEKSKLSKAEKKEKNKLQFKK